MSLSFKSTVLLVAVLIIAGSPGPASEILRAAVAQVETTVGGRVGVVLAQRDSAPIFTHRADERFPMSSTFKTPLCAAVLARVDRGEEDLARDITVTEADLVPYAPVTEAAAGDTMTVHDLCEATITLSDNPAANLLLATVGGPSGLTSFLRQAGDPVTRLDRWETDLNEARPDDARDTTTPKAMAGTFERLAFGDLLAETSRAQLIDWMRRDKVADALIRAALPDDWGIADKTGGGGYGARSIIALIEPPDMPPYIAVIYLHENDAEFDQLNAAVALIGRAMIDTIKMQK